MSLSPVGDEFVVAAENVWRCLALFVEYCCTFAMQKPYFKKKGDT